jgi:ABC-type phosphate/phosphonate transport system substrate-binding protein
MRWRFGILFLILAISGAPFVGATIADEPKMVRFGMLPTMFRSGKAASFAALRGPFVSVVESQTGSRYQLALLKSTQEMQRELTDGHLQFGLCHGFEFAWMKQADPKLRPIMIAAPAQTPLKGYVVVTDSSSAKSLSDLRGTTVALPHGIHQTARLFAERQCQCVEDKPSDQFREITTPINAETALHELCDGKVQSAIVDTSGLRCFEERYPARYKRLRIVDESPAFPMTVVAVRDGGVEANIIHRFETGMLKAKTTLIGRQLIALMQCGGFETVPADYDRQLDDIARQFPAPSETK